MKSKDTIRRKRFMVGLISFLVVIFLISFAGTVHFSTISVGMSSHDAIAAQAMEPVSGPPLSFADLAEKIKPAVVNIRTTKMVNAGGVQSPFGDPRFKRFFGGEEFFKKFFGDIPGRHFKQRSLGSGFIISKDGFIFTNNHVVEKADKIVVKLSNGKEYDAKVTGRDENTDIALLKIEPDNGLPVVRLGDSSKLRVGEWVIAIGNPFGLSQTVTVGIVSAKGRVIGAGSYDDFIQTDASINPGNSGGPLFSLSGEVVGINTAIVVQGQGIGFAIPINMAKDILPNLRTTGKVVRGWLGVSVQEITDDIARNLNLKDEKGALVSDVFKGDPADKAGIMTGDVIVEIEGKTVKDTHDLLKIVAGITVGDEVRICVLRNGRIKMFLVKVTERPNSSDRSEEINKKNEEYFGMTVQEITPEIAAHLGILVATGVIITQVESGSAAKDAGIQTGDILRQINRTPISSLTEYQAAMSRASTGASVLVLIQRGQSKFFAVIRE
ncbi:MAG: DegQ family serine endoprotease [Thermodesulfobacteriota bacterium]|nr:DegQ family serine endoprotease [Thermodesulfobacteriota bacterium]